ncbi:MAG: glycosyltransferase family A protein, partial [Spirochaetota bacterium]
RKRPVSRYPMETISILKNIDVTVEKKDYDLSRTFAPYTMITPVKNEQDGVVDFMKSIDAQIYPPVESIIVDGGSTDGTVRLMQEYASRSKVRFRIMQIESTSISLQRNTALREASTEIIVCADAGCILDPRYGGNLAGSLAAHPDAQMAGGIFYAKNPRLEQFFIFSWDEIARWQDYLPAGKCMAIRREKALEIGGFPEQLPYAGEDYMFDIRYRQKSDHWVINTAASVIWDIPCSWESAVQKYHDYGKGDGQSGLGDYIHCRAYRTFQEGGPLPADPIARAQFEGYLEGRRERAEIEIKRRKIQSLAIVAGTGTYNTRHEQIALIRALTAQNIKVIYIATGFLHTGKTMHHDIDYSLVEFYGASEKYPYECMNYREIADKVSFYPLCSKKDADEIELKLLKVFPDMKVRQP